MSQPDQANISPSTPAPDTFPIPDPRSAKRTKRFAPLYAALTNLRAIDPGVNATVDTPLAISLHGVTLVFTDKIKFGIEVFKKERKTAPWECLIHTTIETPEVKHELRGEAKGIEGSYTAWGAITQATRDMTNQLQAAQYKVGGRSNLFPTFRAEAGRAATAWQGWIEAVRLFDAYQREVPDVIATRKEAEAKAATSQPAHTTKTPQTTYYYTLDDPQDDDRSEFQAPATDTVDTVVDDIVDAEEDHFKSEPPYGGKVYLYDSPEGGNLIGKWKVEAEHDINLSTSRRPLKPKDQP